MRQVGNAAALSGIRVDSEDPVSEVKLLPRCSRRAMSVSMQVLGSYVVTNGPARREAGVEDRRGRRVICSVRKQQDPGYVLHRALGEQLDIMIARLGSIQDDSCNRRPEWAQPTSQLTITKVAKVPSRRRAAAIGKCKTQCR